MQLTHALSSVDGGGTGGGVGANCAFGPKLTGRFGCRYVSVDYDKNDLEDDTGHAGTFIGLGFRW
jgi:hypothetical protein